MTSPRPAVVARALVFAVAVGAASSATRATGADASSASIRRALRFLYASQVVEPIVVPVGSIGNEIARDYPGDWPQYFSLQGVPGFRVRDVSPFIVAFIHHSLTPVVEDNRRPLGLSARDIRLARSMRQRGIEFISGFESPAGAADAGTFGFWPYDQIPERPRPLVALVLIDWLRGPILGGKRVPLNLHLFPNLLAIPSDADVTATTYAALLDDRTLDGGPASRVPFQRFFVDWRDLGAVPRRLNPPWLPRASGAFLTWLTYRDRSFPRFPNDVDLVVNANVLFALGRYRRLGVPGVAQAVDLINQATALGLHRDHPAEITEYYPDNLMFQYAVSRAFREGGVAALAPAVEVLADDLEASAIQRHDGTVFWDQGAPQLNTAFAMLTLLNAGRNSSLVAQAAAYLISAQKADGGFDAATFFIARASGGQVFEFSSASFTTAMAMEALARHTLARERWRGGRR